MIYAAIPIAFIVLWVTFLAYAALKPRWKQLRLEVKVVGAIVVIAGFLLDIALNWTVGLIIGWGNATLSQKCARLRKEDMGWRGDVAEYLCANWLNPFDAEHC